MKKLLQFGAIAALLALPACGRKSVEFSPVEHQHITETRVDAREIKGAALKRMLGFRAKRLGKKGINTVHLTIQNGEATNLLLRPDGTGLDLVPAKEVARITSRSFATGFVEKIASAAGAVILVPFAFLFTVAGITELLKVTGIVNNPFPGGTGIVIPIAGVYLGLITGALVAVNAVGSSAGRPLRNASWKKMLKQDALGDDNVVIPPNSMAQLLLFTRELVPESITVELTDETGGQRHFPAEVIPQIV